MEYLFRLDCDHFEDDERARTALYYGALRGLAVSPAVPLGAPRASEELLGLLDLRRWRASLESLCCFDRYALGPARRMPLGDAARMLVRELEACGVDSVALQWFSVQGVEVCNVVAEVKGTGGSGGPPRIVVGAHYDAICPREGSLPARGAVDNASGACVLLEMARAVAALAKRGRRPRQDVVFALYTAEELGYFGSKHHVEQLRRSADPRVSLMVNVDTIAYKSSSVDVVLVEMPVRMFEQEFLVKDCARRAGVPLEFSHKPWGSDHISFLEGGYPAILVINRDMMQYEHYHKHTDTPDKVDDAVAWMVIQLIGVLLHKLLYI
eukprot:m51a1_g1576 hypothetical protein (324) ;mRNA; f:95605-96703